MVAEIVWSDEAKDDVRLILEYISAQNPYAANAYVTGLAEACQRLAEFSRSGRRYNSRFRCIVYRNHLVFYRFDEAGDRVWIASAVDGRRDIEELMGEPD